MRYAKAIAAFVGTTATALTSALADDVLSTDETGSLVATFVVGLMTVIAVFQVPNKAPEA